MEIIGFAFHISLGLMLPVSLPRRIATCFTRRAQAIWGENSGRKFELSILIHLYVSYHCRSIQAATDLRRTFYIHCNTCDVQRRVSGIGNHWQIRKQFWLGQKLLEMCQTQSLLSLLPDRFSYNLDPEEREFTVRRHFFNSCYIFTHKKKDLPSPPGF